MPDCSSAGGINIQNDTYNPPLKGLLLPSVIVVFLSAAPGQRLNYESVRLDDSWQPHTKPRNGKEVLAPRRRTKPNSELLLFRQIKHQSVGWPSSKILPLPSRIDPDALALVVYRNGRIIRRVSGDPIVWDWRFERRGKAIVYSPGSRHGGANLLIKIDSGKVLEQWPTSSGNQALSWAEQLRR